MAAIDAIEGLRGVVAASKITGWPTLDLVELEIQNANLDLANLRQLEAEDIYTAFADPALQTIFDAGASGKVQAGAKVTLRVPRNINKLIAAADLTRLLAHTAVQRQEPAAYALFCLEDESSFFGHVRGESTEGLPERVRRYHQALQLWSLLERQSHHIESSSGALLYFGLRKIEILPGFNASDLSDEISSAQIADFVEQPERLDTRREIFISVLSEFLRDQTPGNAFRWLLRATDVFGRRLREGMAIYLAEHSPEKLVQEAKSAALTLSEKLEKIIAGVETKGLSVPAALLLAVKEVQQGAGITTLNCVIAISAITYAMTMLFVHQSQSALLGTLEVTIQSTEKELKDKGLDEENPVLEETFGGLRKRLKWAKGGSLAMAIASWAPVVSVLLAMVFGTPQAKPGVSAPNSSSQSAANPPPIVGGTAGPRTPSPARTPSLAAPTSPATAVRPPLGPRSTSTP